MNFSHTPKKHKTQNIESYFEKWISSFIKIEKFPVQFKDFGSQGKGLVCTKPIKSGEVIFSVPESLLLNTLSIIKITSQTTDQLLFQTLYDYYWEQRTINSHHNPKLSLEPNTFIAFYLLFEKRKGNESFWSPYLNILPSTFTTPLSFSKEVLKHFLSSQILDRALDSKRFFFDQLSLLNLILQENQIKFPTFKHQLMVTEEEFLWAWSVILTRSCYLRLPSPQTTTSCSVIDNCTLVPYIDFCNHSVLSNSFGRFNREKKTYEIISSESYMPGDQVFLSYGKHGNDELFLTYGFAIKRNPFNFISMDLSFSDFSDFAKISNIPFSSKKEKKEEILNNFGITPNSGRKIYDPTLSLNYIEKIKQSNILKKKNSEEKEEEIEGESEEYSENRVEGIVWDVSTYLKIILMSEFDLQNFDQEKFLSDETFISNQNESSLYLFLIHYSNSILKNYNGKNNNHDNNNDSNYYQILSMINREEMRILKNINRYSQYKYKKLQSINQSINQ